MATVARMFDEEKHLVYETRMQSLADVKKLEQVINNA